MKNVENLIFIFERDFVNHDEDIKEIQDVEVNILEEDNKHIKANVNLSVSFDDDEIGIVEISENIYKKKYLKMIAKMEQYQKELE